MAAQSGGSMKALVHAEKNSFVAMAMAMFLSVGEDLEAEFKIIETGHQLLQDRPHPHPTGPRMNPRPSTRGGRFKPTRRRQVTLTNAGDVAVAGRPRIIDQPSRPCFKNRDLDFLTVRRLTPSRCAASMFVPRRSLQHANPRTQGQRLR